MKNGLYLLVLLCLLVITGCITGGTHGSIKDYTFSVPKNVLEKAVLEVIAASPNIERDTDINHYNDGNRYISIKIRLGKIANDYTLMYYGDADYWSHSKSAELSLIYAFDEEGNGGSGTDGGIPWYKYRLRKKLLSLFENDFIKELNKQLDKKGVKISQQ